MTQGWAQEGGGTPGCLRSCASADICQSLSSGALRHPPGRAVRGWVKALPLGARSSSWRGSRAWRCAALTLLGMRAQSPSRALCWVLLRVLGWGQVRGLFPFQFELCAGSVSVEKLQPVSGEGCQFNYLI